MRIKINLTVLAIFIMAVVVIVITLSIIMAQVAYSSVRKENPNNTIKKINLNNEDTTSSIPPNIDKNTYSANSQKYLLLIITQRVLERIIKSNNKIAFMAVYLDDGTIVAHFKPERIGRNIFDADIEFKDYMQEIFSAISSKETYKGVKFDPLLNENMKFIVKPLHINNIDYNLTLLIGINEQNIIKEIKAKKPFIPFE